MHTPVIPAEELNADNDVGLGLREAYQVLWQVRALLIACTNAALDP